NIRSFEAVAFEQLQTGFGLLAHGKLEDLLAVLVNVVHLLIDSFTRGRIEAATAGHIEKTAAGAVDLVDEVDQANRIIFGRLENNGTRAVAKDDAGGAVGVI